MTRRFLLLAGLALPLFVLLAHGEPSRKIRLSVYAGDGVTPACVSGYEKAVKDDAGIDFARITADEIRGGKLSGRDVLIMPGGTASGERKALGKEGVAAVRAFIEKGGGYVGFCAGTYLAAPYDPENLCVLDAETIDGDHWARGVGRVKIRLTAEARKILGVKDETVEIHYENGPLLGPGKRPEIPDFTPLAAFETEMRTNNAPEGIMKGTTAIAAGRFGKGRVLCFSPHPELTPGLEGMVRRAVRWAAGRAP